VNNDDYERAASLARLDQIVATCHEIAERYRDSAVLVGDSPGGVGRLPRLWGGARRLACSEFIREVLNRCRQFANSLFQMYYAALKRSNVRFGRHQSSPVVLTDAEPRSNRGGAR
jgi:hypothetical protein